MSLSLKNANASSINLYKKSLLKQIKFKEDFINLLRIKKIYHSHMNVSILDNNTYVDTGLFYSTEKLINFRKNKRKYSKRFKAKKIKITKAKNFKRLRSRDNFLKKLNKHLLNRVFLTRNLHVKCINWNKKIDPKYTKKLYKRLQKYNYSLFNQKRDLFIDLIKIVSLMANNKECFPIFVKFLGLSFSKINKKKHNVYISFLKLLLNVLIIKLKKTILGMKIIINGRTRGKTRAKTVKIKVGSVSVNTTNNPSLLSKVSVYNAYGAFGIQVLINYASQNQIQETTKRAKTQ